uniref:Uncharacterized protein n=1 Tax=Lepeophtheirus salmonis TaxID=72036 RepID=A0A0K2T4V4_LEPSM
MFVLFLCDQKCPSNKENSSGCAISSTHKSISDKKIFTVDAVLNKRNDRFLAESRAQVQRNFQDHTSSSGHSLRHRGIRRHQDASLLVKGGKREIEQ